MAPRGPKKRTFAFGNSPQLTWEQFCETEELKIPKNPLKMPLSTILILHPWPKVKRTTQKKSEKTVHTVLIKISHVSCLNSIKIKLGNPNQRYGNRQR